MIMTKEDLFKLLDEDVTKNKTKPVTAVQEFAQLEGNAMAITEVFGKDWRMFYNECAKRWPADTQQFKQIGLDWFRSKFFVNDATKFLERIKATDDEKAYYHCKVFQQLDKETNKAMPVKFPNGTLSYIGARTHRGKTTAMISMAVDAVQQGKTTFFFTNEESCNQIIMRFVKAFLYTDYANGKWPASFCENQSRHNYDIEPSVKQDLLIGRDYTKFIQDTLKDAGAENGRNELQRFVWASFRKVAELLQKKQLTIIDGLAQRSFDDLQTTLDMIPTGAVVMLDYIQHIRKPEASGSTANASLQIASQAIADKAAEKDFVFVSGAQLNRGSMDKQGKYDQDTLGEQYMRESGDLEQDAHIIVQIGQQPLPDGMVDAYGCNVSRFYEILKHRDHEKDTSQYRILDNAAFSLFGCMVDDELVYFRPTEIPKDNGTGAKAGAGGGRKKGSKEYKPFEGTKPMGINDITMAY
jgi:hypothetical protein